MTSRSAATLTPLEYFVEGMDCPTCVRKIEGAVERTPGASAARTNLTTQTLVLTLDEAQTSRATLERTLRDLGHTPKPLTDDSGERQAHETNAWYATRQGRLVLTTGGLLLLAYAFSLIEPQLSLWGYAAATLLGTWPLARKAVAGARAGDPFSINTLVSLAAIGALKRPRPPSWSSSSLSVNSSKASLSAVPAAASRPLPVSLLRRLVF